MKFQSVPLGERFLYQGEWFVKHTPLVAVQEASGAQRLIPRSAPVRTAPAEDSAETPAAKPNALLGALESYHNDCLVQVHALADRIDAETLEHLEQALEQEYRAFLNTLRG